jgi:hypothetical protein
MTTQLQHAETRRDGAYAKELEWFEIVATREAELAKAEGTSGADVVDAADPDQVLSSIADRVASLRIELDVARRTAGAAREKRVRAQLEVWRAAAAEKRVQGGKLRQQADEIERHTNTALDEVEKLSGVRPVWPEPPSYSRDGVELSAGLWPVGAVEVVAVPPLNYQLLRNQADDLDREANELEERRVKADGAVSFEGDVDTLIEYLDELGPTVIAPSTRAVRTWAERNGARPGVKSGVLLELVFAGGEIDEVKSRVAPMHRAQVDQSRVAAVAAHNVRVEAQEERALENAGKGLPGSLV